MESAAAAAAAATTTAKEEPCNVRINELKDGTLIGTTNLLEHVPEHLQTKITPHNETTASDKSPTHNMKTAATAATTDEKTKKNKYYVIDKHNKVGSFEVKSKKKCKLTNVLYYVFLFRATKDWLVRKKEGKVKNKMPLFHKGNYVLVFSRRGNCFPEKNDDVIIRSDLKNKKSSKMKPNIHNRKFWEIRDNCIFIGRLTCNFKATIIGETHLVGEKKNINVYGIPIDCTENDQTSKAISDGSKEKNYKVIWIDYDEKEAAVCAYKDLDVVTYGKIFLPCDQEQSYVTASPVPTISLAAATITQPVMQATAIDKDGNMNAEIAKNNYSDISAVAKQHEDEDEKEDEGMAEDEPSEVSTVAKQQEKEKKKENNLEETKFIRALLKDEDPDRYYTIEYNGKNIILFKLDDRVISRFIEDSPAKVPLFSAHKRDHDDYKKSDEDDNAGFYPPPAKKTRF